MDVVGMLFQKMHFVIENQDLLYVAGCQTHPSPVEMHVEPRNTLSQIPVLF